jgi:hypothetical protein
VLALTNIMPPDVPEIEIRIQSPTCRRSATPLKYPEPSTVMDVSAVA